MRVHCKLMQFHTPRGSMIQFSASFARWRCCERNFEYILHSVTFYFGKNSHFSGQSGRAGDRACHKEQNVGGPRRPTRPIGSAASVYSAHIDQPEVFVHCKLTQFHSPPSPRVILRYGFHSHLPEAMLRVDFRLPKLTLHSDLRRRAALRLALPCTSSS